MNTILKRRTQKRSGPVYQDTRTKRWGYRFQCNGVSFSKGGFLSCDEAKADRNKRLSELEAGAKLKPSGSHLTFSEAVRWFLTTHCKTLRENAYESRLGLAMGYFNRGREREIKVSEVTSDMVRTFLDNLPQLRREATPRVQSVTDQTVSHYNASLRTFFNRLIKESLWDGKNPALLVPLKKVQKPRVRFYYGQELLDLEQSFGNHKELWPYYVLGLHTGCRIEELRDMRVKDVDPILGQVFLPDSKNGRSRYVHLSPNMVEFVKPLMSGKKPEAWLITQSGSRTERWSYAYLLRHFKLCCVAAGVSLKSGEAWHVLRHTFVQRLLSKGESIYKVSQLVGHSSVSVTQAHYGHLAAADLKSTVQKIDGVISCIQVASEPEKLHPSPIAKMGPVA